MKKKYKKYKISSLQAEKNVIKYLIYYMILGSLIGSVLASYFNSKNFINQQVIFENLSFLQGKSPITYIEIFLKNSKYLIIIWFLGFISLGKVFIRFFVFLKGFNFGFTSAIILSSFTLDSLKYIALNYIPQSFISIPIYIFIAFSGLNYIFKNKETNSLNTFYQYLYILAIIFIYSLLISFFDILFINNFKIH